MPGAINFGTSADGTEGLTHRMIIDSPVGSDPTSSPSRALHVKSLDSGYVELRLEGGSSGGSSIEFYSGSVGLADAYADTNKNFYIRTGTTQWLKLDASQNAEFAGIAFSLKTIEVLGQNLTHGASRIKISQENTGLSEFRFYGADTSTAGSLRFLGSSSDASVGGTRMTIASSGAYFNDSQPAELDIQRKLKVPQLRLKNTNQTNASELILDANIIRFGCW